jgi:hypothetical protein
MSNWRIEQASLGTSSCRECGKPIKKGEWRFGKTVNEPRWFHLRCAERGAPVVFPPFAKQAKAILGDRAEVRRPLTEVDRATVGAARKDSLPVLADWLQAKGDPWGEFIALRLARRHEAAVEFFDEHLESLLGDLNPDDVQWMDGVIHTVSLSGNTAGFAKHFEALFTQRTAARLVSLDVYSKLDAKHLRLLSQKAPATLTSLRLQKEASGLEVLALPSLETLTLELPEPQFAGLLKAKLPNLRTLRLTSRRPLSADFVAGLMECPWFSHLERLEFDELGGVSGTLSNDGLRVLMAQSKRLAHLKFTWVALTDRLAMSADEQKQARALFTRRNARLLKLDSRERDADPGFDPFE